MKILEINPAYAPQVEEFINNLNNRDGSIVQKGCGAKLQAVIHSLQYSSTALTPLRSVQDYGAVAIINKIKISCG